MRPTLGMLRGAGWQPRMLQEGNERTWGQPWVCWEVYLIHLLRLNYTLTFLACNTTHLHPNHFQMDSRVLKASTTKKANRDTGLGWSWHEIFPGRIHNALSGIFLLPNEAFWQLPQGLAFQVGTTTKNGRRCVHRSVLLRVPPRYLGMPLKTEA